MVEVYIRPEACCMIAGVDVKLLKMYTVRTCICIGQGAGSIVEIM
jgi:hypothetical protein